MLLCVFCLYFSNIFSFLDSSFVVLFACLFVCLLLLLLLRSVHEMMIINMDDDDYG